MVNSNYYKQHSCNIHHFIHFGAKMQKPLIYADFFDRKEIGERNSPSGTTFANQLYGFDLNRQTRYRSDSADFAIVSPTLIAYSVMLGMGKYVVVRFVTLPVLTKSAIGQERDSGKARTRSIQSCIRRMP